MSNHRPLSTVHHQPLIVITGPTASGKSALALQLAERYGGEIICADSRTVYKGMDIGTAKPTTEERARVPHHLLDLVTPDQRLTAADFQRQALKAINDIRRRGKIPFLVGGTGLYIDSVILDYRFGPVADEKQRLRLEAHSIEELQTTLLKAEISMPKNALNKRQLIRALEQGGINRTRKVAPDINTIVVAITTDKSSLEKRIRQRAEAMFAMGVIDEARSLSQRYGRQAEAMTGNIYPILQEVLDGKLDEVQAIDKFVVRDRQLAKRQITWLKRHDFVHWLSTEEAKKFLLSEIEHRVRLPDVLV